MLRCQDAEDWFVEDLGRGGEKASMARREAVGEEEGEGPKYA